MARDRSQKHIGKHHPQAGATGLLSETELQMVRTQIRRNSAVIDYFIQAVDLLANKERCPKDANTLGRLRKRLDLAISENDTFRRVLWRHFQVAEYRKSQAGRSFDHILFLVGQIRNRERAALAQASTK